MFAKYFEKTGEVELSGSENEFDLLSKQLLIDKTKVAFENENLESFPDIKNLEYVQIQHYSNNLVKISVKDNYLLIEGSPQKLAILSSNLESDGEEIKNYHIHIEYFNDHFYLSPDSIPLIIQYI
jgi:hypothetical protein